MPDRPDQNIGPNMEGPGVQLKREREKRGLLLHDIAQELHLDEWMLQALEEDDFSALGAPVFAKGHMRKYGGLLGLDPDDLMIAYYRKRGRDDSPPPITKISRAEPDKPEMSWRWLRWLVVLVVLAVVVSLAWALYTRVPSSPADSEITDSSAVEPAAELSAAFTTAQTPLPAPLTDDAVAVVDPVDAGLVDIAPEQVMDATTDANSGANTSAEENTVAMQDASAEETAVPPVAAAAEVNLRLSVSDDSWVEVTDSTGRRLIYDMVAAGRTRNVSGLPPIEIFLGLSRSVRLDVNGRFYAIPRSAVRGNTARFVIDPAAN